MQSKSILKNFAKLSGILFLLNHNAYADIIIDNITGKTLDGTSGGSIGGNVWKGVCFQVGQDHTLDNVKLAIANDVGTSTSAQSYVELRADNSGQPVTASILNTLATPTSSSPSPLTGVSYTSPTVVTFVPNNFNCKYQILDSYARLGYFALLALGGD